MDDFEISEGDALTVGGMIGLLVVLVARIICIFSAARNTAAPPSDTNN